MNHIPIDQWDKVLSIIQLQKDYNLTYGEAERRIELMDRIREIVRKRGFCLTTSVPRRPLVIERLLEAARKRNSQLARLREATRKWCEERGY